MDRKNGILIATVLSILISASSDISAQERSVNQAGCVLIDQSRPAQFVSYEGSGTRGEVTLRLHNNTSCTIIVETDDRSPTLLTKLPNRGVRVEPVTTSQDGVRLDLHYLVQDKRRWRAAQPAYRWGDSVFSYELQAGHSATFVVPISHFKKRLDITVPFKYAWEADMPIAMGVGGVIHRVYFLVEDVPAAALASNTMNEQVESAQADE